MIYDILGREVTNLVDQKMNAGVYSVNWNANNNSSGIYFCKMFVDGQSINTMKMVLQR